MKTFKDIEIEVNGSTARGSLVLREDIIVSLFGGHGAYGDGENTFEFAVMNSTGDLYKLSEFDDVIGWLEEDDINKHIKTICDDPDKFLTECAKREIDGIVSLDS